MSALRFSLPLVLLVGLTAPSAAESFPPITDPIVKTECSACHMAFFAEMLPKKSWETMLGNLKDHFGEDASLDAATLALVTTFHLNNAGDVLDSRGAMKWREGLAPGEAPERITLAPRFKKKHGGKEFDAMMIKKDAKSPANCVACHTAAEKGIFEDD